MTALNRFMPAILLSYVAGVNCELTPEQCNDLSKFVANLEVGLSEANEIINNKNMYIDALSQMIADLYTMNIYIKEKMRDYDYGTRYLVKLANDWVCPATYTSKGWIDDNGNKLISITHYMPMPGVDPKG